MRQRFLVPALLLGLLLVSGCGFFKKRAAQVDIEAPAAQVTEPTVAELIEALGDEDQDIRAYAATRLSFKCAR